MFKSTEKRVTNFAFGRSSIELEIESNGGAKEDVVYVKLVHVGKPWITHRSQTVRLFNSRGSVKMELPIDGGRYRIVLQSASSLFGDRFGIVGDLDGYSPRNYLSSHDEDGSYWRLIHSGGGRLSIEKMKIETCSVETITANGIHLVIGFNLPISSGCCVIERKTKRIIPLEYLGSRISIDQETIDSIYEGIKKKESTWDLVVSGKRVRYHDEEIGNPRNSFKYPSLLSSNSDKMMKIYPYWTEDGYLSFSISKMIKN